MKHVAQTIFAEGVGRTLGRLSRRVMRLGRKATGWLTAHGLAPGVAKVVVLVIKLAALGLLLYIAFWASLLLTFAVAAARVARNTEYGEPEEWAIGEQAKHKKNPGYDPILYSDTPDPRFYDPWFDKD